MAKYESTSFYCGTCEEKLDFMSAVNSVMPRAHYVHASDHRFHCYGKRTGPTCQTTELKTERDLGKTRLVIDWRD